MNINLKINNKSIDTSDVYFISEFPIIFQWTYDVDYLSIDETTGEIQEKPPQSSFKLELFYENGTTPVLSINENSQSTYYLSSNLTLLRGANYSGRLEIELEDETSAAVDFSFIYNDIPVISDVFISPDSPTIDNDITLEYSASSDINDVEILTYWYKNGKRQFQFDNKFIVENKYLETNDVWFAEVLPYDGYIYGSGVNSGSVTIKSSKGIIDGSLRILPQEPNTNDILYASFSEFFGETIDLTDTPEVRWFVNNNLNEESVGNYYFRDSFSVGDEVFFQVKLKKEEDYVNSPKIIIQEPSSAIYNILINGEKEPQKVPATNISISWESFNIREDENIKINIGKYYGDNSLLSIAVPASLKSYSLPNDMLNPGESCFVYLNKEGATNLESYAYSFFKTDSVLWDIVENSVGWTIELIYMIGKDQGDEERYQSLYIADGSRSVEIRLFNDRIGVVSSQKWTSNKINSEDPIVLTVVGKGNSLKLYINRNLFFEKDNILDISSSDRYVEIDGRLFPDFLINYKNISYTVRGAFYPDDNNEEYLNYSFYPLFNFKDKEVVSTKGYFTDNDIQMILATNPLFQEDYPAFYSVKTDERERLNAISANNFPIYNASKSPNNEKVAFAGQEGVYVFTNYVINDFEIDVQFENSSELIEGNWDFVTDIDDDRYSISNGAIKINTIG